MDELSGFLVDEMNNSTDEVYQNDMMVHIYALTEFTEGAFEEVRECLLEQGDVVMYEEYKKVKDELDELKNKYIEIYSKWKEQS